MRAQRENDANGFPTGAYWFAGRRISHCPRHGKRWVIEGEWFEIVGWPCGCIRTLNAAVMILVDIARPFQTDVPPPPPKRHLKLVVSR